MVKICCDWCKKEYEIYPSQLKKYKKHFCERKCKYKWNETIAGHWKGKKIPYYRRPKRDVVGEKNGRWKGGKRIDKDGYILVWKPEHPNCDYHGYIREHRFVIEEKIGRLLQRFEVVHHKDGNKQNNKISNLELYENGSKHQKHHYTTNKHLRYSPSWKLDHAKTP